MGHIRDTTATISALAVVIADVAVLGNVKDTLNDILKFLDKNNHKDWIAKFGEFYEIEFDKVIDREYNKKSGERFFS